MMGQAFSKIELVTVREAAAALRVSRMTVYRHIHSGELPSVHFGRSYRIPATAVDAYLNRPTGTSEED
nr:helix-turn-helix domain-containing protein [Arthrobacter castelli]